MYAALMVHMIIVPVARNSTSKSHPKDILHDKSHFYRMAIHLTSNVAFKTRKYIFRQMVIEF